MRRSRVPGFGKMQPWLVIAIALLMIIVATSPGAAQTAGILTIRQAVDEALKKNERLLGGLGRTVARRSLTSAEVRREDASIQQALAEQQVAIDVTAAYYRVVSQKAFVNVARQSLERARKLRDASEAKLDAGLVSQL